MPLFYQKNISEDTKLAIWQIKEQESFFLSRVPLQREITHPHKRMQHLAGRYLLPFLFPDFPYTEIEIAATRKPFLPSEKYHFSISHCNDYAAAIVSNECRVGIDVEFKTQRLQQIKRKFLHNDELRFVNSNAESKQLDLLTILWSAKEAMYKWYGAGLVDFKEMMRTFPFLLQPQGNINAAFMKKEFQQKMLLNYEILEDLTLVWVHSEI